MDLKGLKQFDASWVKFGLGLFSFSKEYSPLSRVIEELNQHTAALRSSRSASPKRVAIEAKARSTNHVLWDL